MASSINWSGVGAVQRTFENPFSVKMAKEDLAALGNAVGDIMGRRNRAAAVDNDPLLERMKARLAELKNAKASADASAAMGGEAVNAEYDAEIADLETKIAAREAEVSTSRKEYENDPEFLTARREYVSNGDRSHLDSFWRNREAARLRKVQEELLEADKKKAEEEQAKDRTAETKAARANVNIAKADLNDAIKTGEKVEQAKGELEKAEAALMKLDPSYVPEENEVDAPELTQAGLDDLDEKLRALERNKNVSNDDVSTFIDSLAPYKKGPFRDAANKMEDRARSIKTVEMKDEANDAAKAAEKKKVDKFNAQDDWLKDPKTMGELNFFVYNAKLKKFVPRAKK